MKSVGAPPALLTSKLCWLFPKFLLIKPRKWRTSASVTTKQGQILKFKIFLGILTVGLRTGPGSTRILTHGSLGDTRTCFFECTKVEDCEVDLTHDQQGRIFAQMIGADTSRRHSSRFRSIYFFFISSFCVQSEENWLSPYDETKIDVSDIVLSEQRPQSQGLSVKKINSQKKLNDIMPKSSTTRVGRWAWNFGDSFAATIKSRPTLKDI